MEVLLGVMGSHVSVDLVEVTLKSSGPAIGPELVDPGSPLSLAVLRLWPIVVPWEGEVGGVVVGVVVA